MGSWRVHKDEWLGCELWQGSINSNGYATCWIDGVPHQAYYVALARAGIDVPAGKVIDHTCRRRLCVFVPHLEVISKNQNELRKWWRYRSQMKFCPKGHEYAIHGRRTPEFGMICRICSGVWRPSQEPELV